MAPHAWPEKNLEVVGDASPERTVKKSGPWGIRWRVNINAKVRRMAIRHTQRDVHWNYFLALEEDLFTVARYVEFSSRNMGTYSLEFARLLLTAASEADVIAKQLVKQISPGARLRNIDDYRAAIVRWSPKFTRQQVTLPRYGLSLKPWTSWSRGASPDWWLANNAIKHDRAASFQSATLKNVLNAMAGLYLLLLHNTRQAGVGELRPAPRLFVPSGTLAMIDTYPDGQALCFV